MTVYEPQWPLLEVMPPDVAEWGWQDEVCPDTGRKHKQGYLRTKSQMRFSGLKKILPGVHLEVARNWAALMTYCKKVESRDPDGNQVHQINDIPSKYVFSDELAAKIVAKYPETFEYWESSEMLSLVRTTALIEIENGRRGVEWIISDPGWKTMWKDCGRSILIRANKVRLTQLQEQTDRQTDTVCDIVEDA